MLLSINSCRCPTCRERQATQRLKDKIITRRINKKIRTLNKLLIKNKLLNGEDDKEINTASFQGFRFA